jgi:GNAT superfamily N-acetyltransferase
VPDLTPLTPVEKLTAAHRVEAFRSGKHSLDLFLRRHALKNQEADSSQTYVVRRGEAVAGYYSLTVGSVEREEAPPAVAEGMPPYPIPVVLLARLAVDRTEQGRGLGRALLKDALLRAAAAAEIVGAKAVLVHALDPEARAFYQRYGFEEFPAGSLQLMLTLAEIRAALGWGGEKEEGHARS